MNLGAENKKQLMILGGLIAAILLVTVVEFVFMGGHGSPSSGQVAEVPTDTNAADGKGSATHNPTAPGGPPGGATAPLAPATGGPEPGAAVPAAGGPPPASTTSAASVSLTDPVGARQDPFAQFSTIQATPTPTPQQLPPPVDLPPPDSASLPGSFGGSSGDGQSRFSVPDTALIGLPQVHFTSTSSVGAAVQTPPARASGDDQTLQPSGNKRLSGVIIGDSVRALLEVTDGDEVITHVVQPGDEVEGIKILQIEKIVEGGRTITRMIINDNGRPGYVDLKARPEQGTQGGAGGTGGPPGGGAPRAAGGGPPLPP